MEKGKVKDILTISLPLLGIAAISLLGFSDSVKQQARERQHDICPVCGNKLCTHKHIEGHHAVCRTLGGNNSVENCVMVGGDRDRDDHEFLDQKALKEGMIFLPPDGPLIPIDEAPVEMFRNPSLKENAIHRFLHGDIGHIFHAPTHHRKKHKHNKHRR